MSLYMAERFPCGVKHQIIMSIHQPSTMTNYSIVFVRYKDLFCITLHRHQEFFDAVVKCVVVIEPQFYSLVLKNSDRIILIKIKIKKERKMNHFTFQKNLNI